MGSLAIAAVGADRPGIIAALTRVIADAGGNLEDGSMTVLTGHFAIMLLVDIEDDPRRLEEALQEATERFGLTVTVREVGPADRPPPPTHLLSVYGSDRPGIVAEVSGALADADINITDLTTRVIDGERAVYAMALEIALPEGADADTVRASVDRAVADVEVSLHPLDTTVY